VTAAPGRPPASPSRRPVEVTDVRLPRGLTVRNASIDDAILVTELSAACELADDGEVQITMEDTLSEWSRPTFDPSSDVRLVFDRDRVVGYAEVFGARKAWGYVHPEHRGRGIGAALVDWTERYARRGGGRLVGQSISENETAARDLFLSRGYGPLWNSWILEKELAHDEAPPALSGGLRLRNFEAGRDDLRCTRWWRTPSTNGPTGTRPRSRTGGP
jgi:mycothiol synthase